MTLIFLFAGFSLLLLWILIPILTAGRTGSAPDRDMLMERAESLQRSLQEIQSSSERKKLAPDDLENIQKRLMIRLARVYHQLGINPDSTTESAPPSAEECDACGTQLQSAFKFCPRCGSKAAAA